MNTKSDQWFSVGAQGVLQCTRTEDEHMFVRFRGEIVAFYPLSRPFESYWRDSHNSPVSASYTLVSQPDEIGTTVMFQQRVASQEVDVVVGWLSIRIDTERSYAVTVGSISQHETNPPPEAIHPTTEQSDIVVTVPSPFG